LHRKEITMTTPHTIPVDGVGPVEVTVTERGEGEPVLLLHGGGGPQTVAGFADLLAATRPVRVLTPVHPGFAGTPRPDALDSIGALARLYAGLLDALDLTGVTVIGNSIGGWITAELALLDSPRVRRVVLVDAVGIAVPGHPVVDFFALGLDEVAEHSYFDPAAFRIDLDALPPAARAAMAGNRAALAVYGGTGMTDPTLRERLAGVRVPTVVVWGEADRIADPDYGAALADAIPGAAFELLRGTGHLPQLETPELLRDTLLPA
jgi:pimeloyl-ACP methyl ester carboxylesterase